MAVSLKISLDGGKVVKTMQFDASTTVYDACRIIREKNEICTGEGLSIFSFNIIIILIITGSASGYRKHAIPFAYEHSPSGAGARNPLS